MKGVLSQGPPLLIFYLMPARAEQAAGPHVCFYTGRSRRGALLRSMPAQDTGRRRTHLARSSGQNKIVAESGEKCQATAASVHKHPTWGRTIRDIRKIEEAPRYALLPSTERERATGIHAKARKLSKTQKRCHTLAGMSKSMRSHQAPIRHASAWISCGRC
jgi:hypothetical protein